MDMITIVVIAIPLILVIYLFSGKFGRIAAPPPGAPGRLQRVRVQWVIDGDTVIVSHSWHTTRIRLSGIDCPEHGQPWGNMARDGLVEIVGGRSVYIEAHGFDKHGRTVATIYLHYGKAFEWTNVNERMVMLGHAWVMRNFSGHLSESRQRQLDNLEKWARSKRVGLWGLGNPIPPWKWRKRTS